MQVRVTVLAIDDVVIPHDRFPAHSSSDRAGFVLCEAICEKMSLLLCFIRSVVMAQNQVAKAN